MSSLSIFSLLSRILICINTILCSGCGKIRNAGTRNSGIRNNKFGAVKSGTTSLVRLNLDYLKLAFKNRNERLCKIKNDEFKPLTSKDDIFHGSISSILNELPKNIRSEMKRRVFSKLIKQYLLDFALPRNTNSV